MSVLVKALLLPKNQLTVATPDESLFSALRRINEKNFLSIPVVEGNKFIGVISKEKIYQEYFEYGGDRDAYLNETKVRELVRCDIPVLKPHDEIEKAAYTLEMYGIPFVAVTNDQGMFEGIITHHAIFKEFAEIMGINSGKKITIIAHDIPGQIAKLTEIISRLGADIISFVVLDPKVKTDVKEVAVRINANNFVQVVDAIRDAGFRVQ